MPTPKDPPRAASDLRRRVERLSLRPAAYLAAAPRWVVFLGAVALLLTGLFVRGPGGAVALLGIAGLLGWLLTLSWPRLEPGPRLGRMAAVALVVVAAGWQAGR
ncbi:MAG TPA: DUF6703 family protein [Mycobacteriales bacterium]|nr:DUF6703 family protein [Mycobacteriales bacterium]